MLMAFQRDGGGAGAPSPQPWTVSYVVFFVANLPADRAVEERLKGKAELGMKPENSFVSKSITSC